MKIIKQCPFTNTLNTREIDVSEQELADWKQGTLIQDAMPNVSAEDREYIKTGITPTMWESIFGNPKENHISFETQTHEIPN